MKHLLIQLTAILCIAACLLASCGEEAASSAEPVVSGETSAEQSEESAKESSEPEESKEPQESSEPAESPEPAESSEPEESSEPSYSLWRVPDKIPLPRDGSSLELVSTCDRDAFPFLWAKHALVRNGALYCYWQDGIVYDAKTGEAWIRTNEIHDGFQTLTELNGVIWMLFDDGVAASFDTETKETKTYPGVSKHLTFPESYYPHLEYVKQFLIRKDRNEPLIVTYLVHDLFGEGVYYTVDGEQVETGDHFVPGENDRIVLGGKEIRFEYPDVCMINIRRMQNGEVWVEYYENWFDLTGSSLGDEGLVIASLNMVYDENGKCRGCFYYEAIDYEGEEAPSDGTTFRLGDKRYDRGKSIELLMIGGKVFENCTISPEVMFDEAGEPYVLIPNGDKWELYRVRMTKRRTDVAKRLEEIYGQ